MYISEKGQIPSQSGDCNDQFPFARQMRVSSPIKT